MEMTVYDFGEKAIYPKPELKTPYEVLDHYHQLIEEHGSHGRTYPRLQRETGSYGQEPGLGGFRPKRCVVPNHGVARGADWISDQASTGERQVTIDTAKMLKVGDKIKHSGVWAYRIGAPSTFEVMTVDAECIRVRNERGYVSRYELIGCTVFCTQDFFAACSKAGQ